jgi:hypothetical protein
LLALPCRSQVLTNNGSVVNILSTAVISGGSLDNKSGTITNAGTIAVNNITVQSGAVLTNNATLKIKGALAGTGTITSTAGSVELNGTSAQAIPAAIFTTNTVKNLSTNNTAGVTLNGDLAITDVLKAFTGNFSTGNYLTLLSTATKTALVDGTGGGNILGNVTMQRYLPSGFGYRYISAPFQAAKVAQLSDDVDLRASFPTVYRYDENLASAGWVNHTDSTGLLNPMQGYAVNFGAASPAKTIDISGVVNNGTINAAALYNRNRTYTQGFNLAGNPYPSPIDWKASGGWAKTNIDDAIYYFNNGSTDQYGGTYSSYVNGVSSDGVASPIIASMQGFFIHVSNGAYPVSASLSVNNSARVNSFAPVFHKQTGGPDYPLVRLSAGYADSSSFSDPTVVYFNNDASAAFEPGHDAMKMLNTDARVPSLYSLSSTDKLSINGIPQPGDSSVVIPLGLKVERDGTVVIKVRDILDLPFGLHPYLADAQRGSIQDLEQTPEYRQVMSKGTYEGRFSLIFSRKTNEPIPGMDATLKAYSSGNQLFVYLPGDRGEISVVNTMGQLIKSETFSGEGYHQINIDAASGIYIVTLNTPKARLSGKVLIGG